MSGVQGLNDPLTLLLLEIVPWVSRHASRLLSQCVYNNNNNNNNNNSNNNNNNSNTVINIYWLSYKNYSEPISNKNKIYLIYLDSTTMFLNQ